MSRVLRQAAYRSCPLCGNSELRVLHQLRLVQPSASPLPVAYELQACEGCDFVFADTPATQAIYDEYYCQWAKYAGLTESGAGVSLTDGLRLQAQAERIAGIVPDRSASVLDIGSGRGGLLKALQKLGYQNLHAADPDPGCVAAMKEEGIWAVSANLTDLPQLALEGPFELIILSHVAEHVRDLTLLKAVRTLLAENGKLYIEVPDATRYVDYPRTPYYYLDSEHINHFGLHALRQLFSMLGLQCQAHISGELLLADDQRYPILAAWGGQTDYVSSIAVDTQINTQALCCYLHNCESAITTLFECEPPLPVDMPVLLWGAGSMAQRVLGLGLSERFNLVGLLDSAPNKQGQQMADLPIYSPEEGLARFPHAAVLICAAIETQQILDQCVALEPGRQRSIHRFALASPST